MLGAFGVCILLYNSRGLLGTKEERLVVLSKDEIILLHTPGGMLEVSTLVRNEEFKWQTSRSCPILDCGKLFGRTVSEIRVPVHYTYRIPLAAEWTLRRKGDHYELSVPSEVPKLPPAADLTKLEIKSSRGWLSPSVQGNRESLLTHFGPEIIARSSQKSYLDAQRNTARTTVVQFARKWLVEQRNGAITSSSRIDVLFPGES